MPETLSAKGERERESLSEIRYFIRKKLLSQMDRGAFTPRLCPLFDFGEEGSPSSIIFIIRQCPVHPTWIRNNSLFRCCFTYIVRKGKAEESSRVLYTRYRGIRESEREWKKRRERSRWNSCRARGAVLGDNGNMQGFRGDGPTRTEYKCSY